MGSAAFLTLDTENAKNNGPLIGFQSPSVITMAYQAAGMPAAAVKSIQWKVCCNPAIDFFCYPLEFCENSCYHDNVLQKQPFGCFWGRAGTYFLRVGFLLFVICAGLRASCHDTMFR